MNDEYFGNGLLANLIRQAETLDQHLKRFPTHLAYPSVSRTSLIEFLLQLNAAIIQRLQQLRAGPPPPRYTTVELPARRLGIVLTLLFNLLEVVVHSEAQRIPSPLVAPFESILRRFFPTAMLLVRYSWEYNFHYENLGRFLTASSQYSGLQLPAPPPEHFIVLGFPATERENVLLHCAFGHEVGHFLAQALQLENRIPVTIEPASYQAIPAQDQPNVFYAILAWYRELFSDAFGIYLLGPAYFLAFSQIGLQALSMPSLDHPHPHLRLNWMLTLLRRRGYLDERDAAGTVVRAGVPDNEFKQHLEEWAAFLQNNPPPQLGLFYRCVSDAVSLALDLIEDQVRAIVGPHGYTPEEYIREVEPLTGRILHLIPPVEGDGVPAPSFISILNSGWVVNATRLPQLEELLAATTPDARAEVRKILSSILYKAIEYHVIKSLWGTLA